MPVELELGATDDPRALILGDRDALAATQARLQAMAASFGETADGLDRITVGDWRGGAADAFRTRFPLASQQWWQARDAFGSAATSWGGYRDAVGRAQASAADAVARYRAGVAASHQAVAQRRAAVDRYNAQIRAADTGAGPPPAALPAFVDPGPGQIAAARSVLARARGERDAVAERAAAAMRAAAAVAPDPPAGWDALVADAGDGLGAGLDDLGRLAGGVAEGGEGLLRSARALNPTDPWNLSHPAHYADAVSTTVAGLAASAVHPVRLVDSVVGEGWGSDPAAAAGRLVPTALAAALSDGAAAGVRPAAGAVERGAAERGAAERGAGERGAAEQAGTERSAAERSALERSALERTAAGAAQTTGVPPARVQASGVPASEVPASGVRDAGVPGAGVPAARVRGARVPGVGDQGVGDRGVGERGVGERGVGERAAPPPARAAWRDVPRPGHDDQTGPLRRRPTGSPLVEFREARPAAPTHTAASSAPLSDHGPASAPAEPPGAPDPGRALAAVDERVAAELTNLAMHRSIIGGLGLDIPYVPLHPDLGITDVVTPPPVITPTSGGTGSGGTGSGRTGSDGTGSGGTGSGGTTVPAGPAAPILDASGRPVVPAGFANSGEFRLFGDALIRGLAQAGHPDVRALFQGSSVTGVRYTTGVPFDVGRTSDYDIALVGRDLLTAAKAAGIPVRRSPPPRTRPLETQDLDLLGLRPLAEQLSTIAGRKVNFMVYATTEEAERRSPSVEVGHP